LLRGLRVWAFLAVVIGASLCGALALAQTNAVGSIGEMPLAGGLRPLLAAIDDPLPPDRSEFLLEFIRRTTHLRRSRTVRVTRCCVRR
jgi:hypothetical protein